MSTEYVVGFVFRHGFSSVVLVKKNKPEWQAGLLNGVGGKIEDGETPREAMNREFTEETGALIPEAAWRKFCYMQGPHFQLHCFVAVDSSAHDYAKTMESEEVVKVAPDSLARSDGVSNLKWLVEMAMDENEGRHFMATLQYP